MELDTLFSVCVAPLFYACALDIEWNELHFAAVAVKPVISAHDKLVIGFHAACKRIGDGFALFRLEKQLCGYRICFVAYGERNYAAAVAPFARFERFYRTANDYASHVVSYVAHAYGRLFNWATHD